MNRWIAAAAVAALACATPAAAQEPTPGERPTAGPDGVATVDGIIEALYASISGPAGERDWDRFRSLFLPGAILMNASPRPDTVPPPSPVSPEGYAERAAPYFRDHAFYEVESDRTELRFGTVLTAWSTYESRHDPTEEPFARGINSITLIRHGGRWWVASILWDSERPDNPIPAEYGGG